MLLGSRTWAASCGENQSPAWAAGMLQDIVPCQDGTGGTDDPYFAPRQHRWVAHITCCLFAEIRLSGGHKGWISSHCVTALGLLVIPRAANCALTLGHQKRVPSHNGDTEVAGTAGRKTYTLWQTKNSLLPHASVISYRGPWHCLGTEDVLILGVVGARDQWLENWG